MAMRQRDSLQQDFEILARMARYTQQGKEPEKQAKAAFLIWIMAQPDPLDTRQAAEQMIAKHADNPHPVIGAFVTLLRQTLQPPRRRNRRSGRLI